MTRPRLDPLGPLFWEELYRLGRRGSFFQLRTAVPLFLLLSLWAVYPADDQVVTVTSKAVIAAELFTFVLAAQMAVVWFLAPLFAAAVLTEERERKTLDLLLTTTLTAWDLAAGKLFARLAFVGGVLLAGLPAFGVLLLFGGLDPMAVAAGYAATALNLWSVGGLTAGIASLCRSYRVALFFAWGLSLFAAILPFGPVHTVRLLTSDSLTPLGHVVYAGLHLCLGLGGLMVAVWNVRPWLPAERPPTPLPIAKPVLRTRTVYDPEFAPRPPTDHTKPSGVPLDFSWHAPVGPADGPTGDQLTGFLFAGAVVLGGLVGLAWTDDTFPPIEYPLYMGMAWILPGILTAVSAAGCVSREREGDTLTTLLTTPPGRGEILWRKWWAAAGRFLWAWLAVLVIGGLILLPADDGVFWALGYLAVGAAGLAAATSAGVFYSVTCSTTFLAQAASVMTVLAAGVFPGWWAAIISDGGRATGFVPVQAAVLAVVGWAGWHLARDAFHGYAKG